jgi:hypothetical protein
MVDMLIDERRRRNDHYHRAYGRSRHDFWSSVARRFVCMIFYKKIQIQIIHLCKFRINNRYHTSFSGQQCSQKWRNLVRDYHASKKNKNKFIRIKHVCLILHYFLIFRTFVFIVVESLRDLEEDYGRVPAKDIIDYLEQDFGRGRVIIIRISIINVLFTF